MGESVSFTSLNLKIKKMHSFDDEFEYDDDDDDDDDDENNNDNNNYDKEEK